LTRFLTRRSLALGLAALPIAAQAAPTPLTPEEQALVAKATGYLQGLGEAKSRFLQTDARGRSSQGVVYLKRPGKARFAYDPPSGLLVVSDGAFVSVADQRLKTFERYPLISTPLSLFLAKQIRLDRGVAVSRVVRFSDGFAITARDSRKSTQGEITLTFADQPMQLLGWTITDTRRQETRIRLAGLAPASGLDPALFVLKDPRPVAPGRARM